MPAFFNKSIGDINLPPVHQVSSIRPQGSPLLPIFRALSRSLDNHSSIAQGHLHTIHPSIQPNLCLPHTQPPITSAINTLLAVRYTPFFPHAQTISILCDPLYLSIPALLCTSSFLTLSNQRHSNQTSRTLHLKNIHFPSLSTSHTPMPLLRTTPFVQLLLHIDTSCPYPQSSIAQHTFQLSPSSIPLIH